MPITVYTQHNMTANTLGLHSLVPSNYPPSETWIGLLTTLPNLANIGQDGVTELNGGSGIVEIPTKIGTTSTGYGRKKITSWSTLADDYNCSFSNSNEIDFGTPATAWGTLQGVGLFDGSTANAKLLSSVRFPTPQTVNINDSNIRIPIGDFEFAREINSVQSNYALKNSTRNLLGITADIPTTFPPSEVWMGLAITIPNLRNISDDGVTNIGAGSGLVEAPLQINGNPTGYQRIKTSVWSFTPNDYNGNWSNASEIRFNSALQAWGTIRGFVLFDGNSPNSRIIVASNFDTPRVVDANTDEFIIRIKSLTFSRAG